MSSLVILGCGYVGTRVARTALAAGRVVRVCGRGTGRMAPLRELGAHVQYLDAAQPRQFPTALAAIHGGTILYSIPPVTELPPGHAMRAALQAAYGAGAACFIYLSSAGLYGDDPDDEAWIDEDTAVVTTDPAMKAVLADEHEIDTCRFDRLRTVILRLAPVYGPGRGVRARLAKGSYKMLDDGEHATSRIHVDDLVRVIAAAEERGPARSRYLVADDEPTTQAAYATWLAERLGVAMPPSRPQLEAGSPKVAHRNRRIRNARLKAELGVELRYPSFREGEAAIEAEASQ